MAKTLKQVLEQIESLQQEAQTLRKKEVAEVIERIKVAIDFYNLTPRDLFGNETGNRRQVDKAPATGKAKVVGVPKYTDGAGKTWTGKGTRPKWFVEALAAGRTEADLLIGEGGSAFGTRVKAAKPATTVKRGGVPKFTDGAGRTWSGVGKRPGWFVEAIAQGKSADDLLIKG